MRRPIAAAALAAVLLSAAAASWSCKDDIASGDPNDIVFPASGVKYHDHVEPLFFRTCVFSGCHNTESRAGGLSVETWQETIDSDPGVVYLQDTARSRLVWRIEGRYGLEPMPLLRPRLNANQINGIKTWIMEGAQNN